MSDRNLNGESSRRPQRLKRDFGKDVTFWDGGFVIITVHNIQADVLPGNIMAMWEALQKYGVY